MTTAVPATRHGPGLRRRWNRRVLRLSGLLDGEHADRLLPWVFTGVAFVVLVALDAAAMRSLEGGSGLAPWIQAAHRRDQSWAATAVGGVDPARATWSLVSEPILQLTRLVPAPATFSVIQAAAIALAIVPLWRLARDEARLRVSAASVVTVCFVLAPTLQRTNLSAFHPEVIALPALLWAYRFARQGRWVRYGLLVVVIVCCRADLGLTVTAMGLLLVSEGRRVPGLVSAGFGVLWSVAAVVVLGPELPEGALTPAGEFVARATAPLAVIPRVVTHPVSELGGLLAEPSVQFLVVVLAPLLFLPLVSPRKLAVALPGLLLAMIADRSVQRAADARVLDLSPAAAHIAPSMSFVFIALVFALERIGELSVTRVNVDRRVLIALVAGSALFFVTEAPTSPYRQPWAWGSQDKVDGARLLAAAEVRPSDAVAASPAAIAQVADRAVLVELPVDPDDFTADRMRGSLRGVDVVLLDTTGIDRRTGEPVWTDGRRRAVIARMGALDFEPVFDAQDVFLLRREGST